MRLKLSVSVLMNSVSVSLMEKFITLLLTVLSIINNKLNMPSRLNQIGVNGDAQKDFSL